MEMVNRYSSAGSFRYGFNGKEQDPEVKGTGNQYDYGKRIYDPRIAKFLSVDPIQAKYPDLTPYQFASNSPIAHIDLDGLEKYHYTFTFDQQGQTHIQLSSTEHFSEWQWKSKWGGTNLGFQLWEKVQDPRKEYIVEYKFQDYLVVGVAAEPVTTTYTATFNSESGALNAKFSDFDGAIRKGEIAKGMMAGVDMPGIPTRSRRLTPESETNKAAAEAHTGNTASEGANTAGSSQTTSSGFNTAGQTLGRSASSEVLGRNLEASGTQRPSNTAAHHIVAGDDPRAAVARGILAREGIDINQDVNGVFLPKNSNYANPPAQTHSTIHTNRYYQEVNSRLLNAAPGQVGQELGNIKAELLNGTFPR